MGRTCAVIDCSKEKSDGITLFSMPMGDERSKWLRFLSYVNENYRWKEVKCMYLCSDHFSPCKIRLGYQGGSRLTEGATPTLLNGKVVGDDDKNHLASNQTFDDRMECDGNMELETPTCNAVVLSGSDNYLAPEIKPTEPEDTMQMLLQKKEEEAIQLNVRLTEQAFTIEKINKSLGSCRRALKARNRAWKTLNRRKNQLYTENQAFAKRLNYLEKSNVKNECGILMELQNRQKMKKKAPYSDALRNFSYTVRYYSARAYEYLRKSIPLLPAPRTFSRWTSHLIVSPGFLQASMLHLKSLNGSTDATMYYAISVDEMHIRKQIIHRGNEFIGYVNYGDLAEVDGDGKPATTALFFVATQVNGLKKFPVAYALTNGLKANVLAEMIKNVLSAMANIKARVISITFDGMPSNLKAVELMGANLNPKKEGFKPYVMHPTTDQKVFIILDPSHMMKLMRNTFKDYAVLVNGNNQEICWSHVQALQKLQEDSGLKAANKLSSRHVYFQNQKMKSKLCLQVLSNSVAVALGVCRELEIVGFEQTQGTEQFLSYMDKLFDLLNSRTRGQYYKAAFRPKNIPERHKFFVECRTYLMQLKRKDGVPLMDTPRGTAIRGLIVNMQSVDFMCNELICAENESLRYLPVYKLSQDMVESLFGLFRARNGHNNNPNVVQLESAVKSTLCMRTEAIKNGNCEEQEDTGTRVSPLKRLQTIVDDTEDIAYEESQSEENCEIPPEELSPFVSNIVVYIAGWAASRLCARLSCVKCIALLHLKEEDFAKVGNEFVLLKNRDLGGLFLPSLLTIAVCKIAEKKIRHFKTLGLYKMNKKLITDEILQACRKEFVSLKCEACMDGVDHSECCIRELIADYTKARFHHLAKQATLKLNPTTNRDTCKRNVILNGN